MALCNPTPCHVVGGLSVLLDGPPPFSSHALSMLSPRLVPNEDGQGIAGLPDLRIFGALMRSTHTALIAAAVLFFGAKGLLGGALLW